MTSAISPARNVKKILLATAALAALAVGCSPTAPDDASSKSQSGKAVSKTKSENSAQLAPAACAEPLDVEFHGRVYRAVENVDFRIGNKVGKAVSVMCDDTDRKSDALVPQPESPAYEIDGVDPGIAIAVDDMFFVVNSGKKLPARVQKLIDDATAETETETPMIENACAEEVEFAGKVYTGITGHRDFKAGNKVGKAVHVACVDTPDDYNDGLVPQSESPAYKIPGVEAGIAIAVVDSSDTMQIYVADLDKPLPAVIQKLTNAS
ncbi:MULTISPECIES: DUF6281 family protein [unclassified Streptomyces]|uniref:DUF6281 family protein n=1 Tax=unclassified Streptomyces TaxID=2593676 RepID=UPI0023659FF6|nr:MULTISPECIES: DUF6281 family protein [unclassified Streptomyces]MDF3143722.1 DUF6281 family protein [Streptomyces sp. T21Q-yed]WDF38860.1 DUF6281 family protein [Streptomyces sp. T12]